MSNSPEYEGKAKQLIPTDDRNVVIQRFKNSATAFNGVKKGEFEGKGALNNAISSLLFSKLEAAGVPTHFISWDNATDMRVHRLQIIPLEVVVRNHVAGSLQKRTGLGEGTPLQPSIVETYYKKDELGDPILADTHVFALGILNADELETVKKAALAVNDVIRPVFADAGLKLIDFKLEFGWDSAGRLILGDEISPDTCRIWDAETNTKLDKDVFRHDLAGLIESYSVVAEKLGVDLNNPVEA